MRPTSVPSGCSSGFRVRNEQHDQSTCAADSLPAIPIWMRVRPRHGQRIAFQHRHAVHQREALMLPPVPSILVGIPMSILPLALAGLCSYTIVAHNGPRRKVQTLSFTDRALLWSAMQPST